MNDMVPEVGPGMVTEIGLRLPFDLPEDQFFAIGQTLSRIERGMQWAIGDWYNAIPWGDKEAACKRGGLNYGNAARCGIVAKQFPIHARSMNVPFTYHKALDTQGLSQNQRADLLEKSSKNAWSFTTLTRERDKLLGKPERVPVKDYDTQVQTVLEQLPASASTLQSVH